MTIYLVITQYLFEERSVDQISTWQVCRVARVRRLCALPCQVVWCCLLPAQRKRALIRTPSDTHQSVSSVNNAFTPNASMYAGHADVQALRPHVRTLLRNPHSVLWNGAGNLMSTSLRCATYDTVRTRIQPMRLHECRSKEENADSAEQCGLEARTLHARTHVSAR